MILLKKVWESMKGAVVFVLLLAIGLGVEGDGSNHKYKEGDQIPLYANKVGLFIIQGLPEALHRLVKKGAFVFLFPEGTRTMYRKLGLFKKGAFSVAAKTEVPIVPITLLGTGNLMHARMGGLLNIGSVGVIIHKSISGTNADILCNEARNVIAQKCMLQRCT